MRIVLKTDWDISVPPPVGEMTEEGHFVGRSSEISILMNEMLRRRRGSILVSGYPGVGKTCLVYKTLTEAKKHNKNITAVLLNAGEIEIEGGGIDRRKTIENIIRRLYSTVSNLDGFDKGLLSDVETLYRKAVATEFENKEIYQEAKESSRRIRSERVVEFFLTGKSIIVFALFWCLALFLQLKHIFPWGWLNNLVPLALALPIPFVANLYLRKHWASEKLEEERRSTEEIYKFDASIGNLQFDLEKVHREIGSGGIKLVYVIDELDKPAIGQVMNLLSFFKNLFTLSDALFVFVGDEKIYEMGAFQATSETKGSYRAKEYTYFTSRYFLARPLWPDLSRFLDMIADKKEGSESELEAWKRSLCFDAKNDFFDLKTCIKDRISSFDTNGKPIIDVQELSQEDVEKGRFHKAVTVLFEEKYLSLNPSRWEENEALVRMLFQRAHEVLSGCVGTPFEDPQGDSIGDEITRDFNSLLHRLGVLNVQSDSQMLIRGVQIAVRKYQCGGSMHVDPPDRLEQRTEFEERYVQEFERYTDYLLAPLNAFGGARQEREVLRSEFLQSPRHGLRRINNWGLGNTAQFDAHRGRYLEMVEHNPPYRFNRKDIEDKTAQLVSCTKALVAGLPGALVFMGLSLYVGSDVKAENLQDDDSLFNVYPRQARSALRDRNHYVLATPDPRRQVLLVHNGMDVLKSIPKEIQGNSDTHRVVCVLEETQNPDIDGLHVVSAESPEVLKDSMTSVLKELSGFLLGESGGQT